MIQYITLNFIEFRNCASSYFVANMHFFSGETKLVAFAMVSISFSSPVGQLSLDSAERGCDHCYSIETFLSVSV